MATTDFTDYTTVIEASWLDDVDALVYGIAQTPETAGTKLYMDDNGNVTLNHSGASRLTTATDGFSYLPDCAGTPTGVPATTYTGSSPVIIDKTNYLMYSYLNGAWRLVGNPLPSYESGKYLTNNGSTLSWGTVATGQWLCFAQGDQTATITTGTAKFTFRLPACTITAVRASLVTASSSGNPAFDINDDGVSIFSTTLTIDANETTSTTAATAAVISGGTIADDSLMTIDIDTAGTGAKGWAIYIYVTWT